MAKRSFSWSGLVLTVIGIIFLFIHPVTCNLIWYNPITWLLYIPCSIFGILLTGFTVVIGIILILIGIVKLIKS